MKTLIVEDEFTTRIIMQRLLSPFGEVHVAVDGVEALSAYVQSLREKDAYDLICLDMLMPNMDGDVVLKQIRQIETDAGIQPGEGAKIIMATSVNDGKAIMKAFKEQCDGYLVKPVDKAGLYAELANLSLIKA